jgi:hypothetical protein
MIKKEEEMLSAVKDRQSKVVKCLVSFLTEVPLLWLRSLYTATVLYCHNYGGDLYGMLLSSMLMLKELL